MEDCECERRLSDPLDPPSEETMKRASDVLEHYLKTMRELNRKSKLPIEVTEEHIKIINRFMEEKKTKKMTMTKAEAFEWLKGTKVVLRTEDDQLNLQKKLFDVGYKWLSSGTTLLKLYDVSCVFFLGIDGFIQHEEYEDEANKLFCDTHVYKPIKLRDILSIEIVEEENEPLDKWDEFARCVAKVQEKIEDDEVCIITKGNFLTMTK